ncbi:MAG: response regulator [Nevskiales bacterium]
MAKVLIVEDDPSLRKIYVSILTKEGFDVTGAFDGKEGLRLASESEPDLILLDMMMPNMTGIEFLRAYDIPGKHPKVKVIAFSNTEQAEFVDESKKLGATAYMAKFRFTPGSLVAMVRETLSVKRE